MLESFEWTTPSKRVAVAAALASAATGILLAIFQVQGWKTPKLLALGLIGLMLLIIGIAALVVILDLVRNVRAFLERRSTSALWVLSEPPGLLDYEADSLRAQNDLNRMFTKLAKDTAKMGKAMLRGSARLERAKNKSGRVKQRRANRTAKHINRSADFIEKRLAALKKLVKELERNYPGLIASLPLETPMDLEAAKAWRNAIEDGRAASLVTLGQIDEYRQTVEAFEALNPSRSLRIASDRLGKALRGIVNTVRSFERTTAGVVREFDRRIGPAKASSSKAA